MVSPEELARLYPQGRTADDLTLEHYADIKNRAYSNRLRERLLPDPEVLSARLAQIGTELAKVRDDRDQLRDRIGQYEARLEQLAGEATEDVKSVVAGLRSLLTGQRSVDASSDAGHLLTVRDNFLRMMTAHVLMIPSQHEYFVEGNDSILEAALRAGFAPDYGCSTGSCGRCRARLVAGQVKTLRAHDFVLSETDRHNHVFLPCCHTAVTDLVIEAAEAGSAHDIPRQEIDARVHRIAALGENIRLLHLQTPRTSRLRFLAGQSVELSVEGDAPVAMTVASCPCDDRNLHFHVRRDAATPLARRVFDGLRPSSTVRVVGPSGEFVLDESSPRPLIFVAMQDGFAPIKSLIEHAMALETAERIHLYWLAGDDSERYLENQCRAWEDAFDHFRYTALAVPPDGEEMKAYLLRVARDHQVLAEHDVYIAGPARLVDAARVLWREHELPAGRCRTLVI
jgi:CDP-4-dehydro-6-deoxyglucose reductase